ncbi:MAG: beta-lactamase family protein, partial [Planctomycetaceae bacterium]|nr:beta-lactamase family protein [Planctomycetaceae bacterium]
MNSQHPHQDLTNSLSLRLSNILTTHQLKHLDLCAGRIGGRRLAWRSDTPAPLQTLHDSNAAQHSSQDCDQPSPLANRRYLVASITKPVVAMLTLQMAAEGLLSLTDRLESFLPAFDRAGLRRITIRNVLTHTSGLPDMLPN